MGIMNLAARKEIAAIGPNVQTTMYIPEGVISLADEFAENFSVTRSEALREMMLHGYRAMLSEWEHAHENGAKLVKEGKRK